MTNELERLRDCLDMESRGEAFTLQKAAWAIRVLYREVVGEIELDLSEFSDKAIRNEFYRRVKEGCYNE